ncbi:hypothetical protein EJ08DRAFT_732286 [Tothia fuscella]|uniref:Uncharacterized protein n=1 Tax=Tothia fuscella TaxID=1048955 RepID=A0A9P4NVI7_9PEZI|nr:hypothetical protein EJ08DRAFT_732286 [Tothia fuscella]
MPRRNTSQHFNERKPKTNTPATVLMRKAFGLQSHPKKKHASFDDLPREVRDRIYGYVMEDLRTTGKTYTHYTHMPTDPRMQLNGPFMVNLDYQLKKSATPKRKEPNRKVLSRNAKRRSKTPRIDGLKIEYGDVNTPTKSQEWDITHKSIIAFFSTCRTVQAELAPKYYSEVNFVLAQKSHDTRGATTFVNWMEAIGPAHREHVKRVHVCEWQDYRQRIIDSNQDTVFLRWDVMDQIQGECLKLQKKKALGQKSKDELYHTMLQGYIGQWRLNWDLVLTETSYPDSRAFEIEVPSALLQVEDVYDLGMGIRFTFQLSDMTV